MCQVFAEQRSARLHAHAKLGRLHGTILAAEVVSVDSDHFMGAVALLSGRSLRYPCTADETMQLCSQCQR